jgi:hypothetical protein
MFTQPYILEELLNHLTGPEDKGAALGLAFALVGCAILEALFINVYFNMLFRCARVRAHVCVCLRVCVCMCVYALGGFRG